MPEVKTSDKYFNEAVRRFVTAADTSGLHSNFGQVGDRTGVTQRMLLSGVASGFSGQPTSIEGFTTLSADEYKNSFIWDMYNGVQFPYLDKLPQEDVSDFQNRPGKVTFNWMRLALHILCKLYEDQPRRVWESKDGTEISEAEYKNLSKIYERSAIDQALGEAERYSKLFGSCLVRPLLADAESQRYEVHVVPKTDYKLLVRRSETTGQNEIKAVVIKSVVVLRSEDGMTEKLQWNHDVWTKDTFASFIDGEYADGILPRQNPYGRIPYLHVTENLNFATQFKQPDWHHEAIENAEFNNAMSLAGFHMAFAGMPVTVTKDNFSPGGAFKLVPGFILELQSMQGGTSPAEFTFDAPPDRVNSFIQYLETFMSFMFQSHGINYSISDGVKAGVSGIAIEVAMAPVLSELKRRAPVAMRVENSFYDLLRIVSDVDAGKPLPDADVKVEFAYTMSVRSELDKRAEIQFKLTNGLMSREQALMEMYPGRYSTEADAKAALPADWVDPNSLPDVRVAPNTGADSKSDGRKQGQQKDGKEI